MAKILVNFANDRFEPARKHNSKTGLTKGGFDRVVECRIEDVEESYRAKYSIFSRLSVVSGCGCGNLI